MSKYDRFILIFEVSVATITLFSTIMFAALLVTVYQAPSPEFASYDNRQTMIVASGFFAASIAVGLARSLNAYIKYRQARNRFLRKHNSRFDRVKRKFERRPVQMAKIGTCQTIQGQFMR